MNQLLCKYCQAPIRMIKTYRGRYSPCNAEVVIRHGSEPPSKGKYYDEQGNFYDASAVPCKTPVWKSHWGDCPGAEKARRDR